MRAWSIGFGARRDSGDHRAGAKTGLFDVGEVILRVFCLGRSSNGPERVLCMRPDFGHIKDIDRRGADDTSLGCMTCTETVQVGNCRRR